MEDRYLLAADFLFGASEFSLLSSYDVTTTGSTASVFSPGIELERKGTIQPNTQQSTPLINLDAFRADPRFIGIDGTGFSSVIIDGGIDLNHPFFGPDADSNGVADRIVFQYDFSGANDSNASDVDGHGSNVSSIVGSSDSVFTGMAPGTGIISLKVFDDGGSGTFGDVEEALQWVVANAATYNIASVNMSLGDSGNYSTATSLYGLGDELAALAAQDVIVVSAAGNDYGFYQAPGVSYPAADPNSLAVGAVWDANNGGPYFWSGGSTDFSTGADRLVSFTQRSTTMTEIFAPGAFITGAGAFGDVTDYAGTSQASPHIAGIATLAQDLAAEVLGRRLTLAEFTTLLTTSAATIFDGDNEDDNVANSLQNYGRVDVLALAESIIALEVPGIDLTATNFSVTPTDLLASGGVIDSSFIIRNLGDTDSQPFNVRFYLSDDAFIDPGTDLPLALAPTDGNYNVLDPGAYRLLGGLLAQTSHVGAVQLIVPSSNPFASDSRHYVGVVIDADNEVGEANEGNNANKGEGIDRQQVNYGSTIAAFPFFEDWEAGTAFGGWWETNPGVEGRIEITPNFGPYAGNHHVILDDTVDGSQYSLNQLILHVDLAGQIGVKLDYAFKSFGDEEDALDSVDISVDGGATWHQITSLEVPEGTEGYVERTYLLDNLGLVYSGDTLLRFQQYDNFGIGSDGLAFDNIQLSSIYGSVSGQKYQDENRNGLRDSDEQGLAGWTIYLDENLDGQMVTAGAVEPDQYDAGILLNNHISGVTFTALGGASPDVYSGPPQGGFASTGSLAFTRNGPFGWSENNRLRIDFDLLMNSVSLDAIADDSFDYGLLEAFDESGNFIGSYITTGLSPGQVETMTVTSFDSRIAYVIASGVFGEVVNLDNLQYEHTDRSTVTDADGNYSFTLLDPGFYFVQEVLQNGWQQITGGHYVFVDSGQSITDLNFGNYPLSGTIQGRKWNDLDGDGIMDPDEPGLSGWTVFVDENDNGILEGGSGNFLSADVPRGIFDFTTTYSTISVAGLQSVTDLNLTLDISHSFTGDMVAYLVSPQGTRVGLFFYVGGSGNNFNNTTFDDEAFLPISSGFAPFTGSYIPAELLSAFDGENPNGVWTLEISDQAGADTGTLNSWSLAIESGEKSTVTDADGYYLLSGIRPGTHVIAEVAQPGWIQTYPSTSLIGTRDNISANSANIAALIPSRYDFSEGEAGNNINDGGSDMYDGGNYLNTNLASFFNYTNGEIVAGDGIFGPDSEYFTAKHQGLFVLGASNIDISSFSLSGNNGADGGGSVDIATLSTVVEGQQYTIYVKRVYGTSDPSINEIIMVPGDGAGINHLYSTDTNNGYHEVSGLSNIDEIYYALVARSGGGYLSNSNVLDIAEEFLAGIGIANVHQVTIGPGEAIGGIDFGNRPLSGEIHGQKWNDLNRNGVKDFGEPGLPGWTIYIDENNNGLFDTSEASVEPDAYAAGTVLNTVVPGITLSLDGAAGINITAQVALSSTGTQVFANSFSGSVWSQGNRLRVDFAIPTAFVSIDAISDDSFDLAGLTAYDAQGNVLDVYNTAGLSTGQFESMVISRSTADIAYVVAAGVSGQALHLDNLRIQESETHAVTDTNGNYSFLDVPAGAYTVREVPQPGWVRSYPTGSGVPVVAFFDDPFFVDSSNSFTAESDNLQASLASLGYGVNLFTGTSGLQWSNALANATVLVIPELENGALHTALSAEAITALQNFVNAGGGLIVYGAYSNFGSSLLNSTFGWSLIESSSEPVSFSRTAGTTGTEFADDPVSIPWNDGTSTLESASLPAAASSLYENSNDSVVALLTYGSGSVVYLGYDWFDAVPVGSQDGGWLEVLESSILQVGGSTDGGHHVVIGPGNVLTGVDFGNYEDAPSLSADFDQDGDVDGRDFLAWQRGSGVSLPTRADGDADGDGDVDSGDLGIWQGEYGAGLSVALAASEVEEDFATEFPQRMLLSSVEDALAVPQESQPETSTFTSNWWLSFEDRVEVELESFVESKEPYSETTATDEVFESWDIASDREDEFGDISTGWREDSDEPVEGELEKLMAAVFGGQ